MLRNFIVIVLLLVTKLFALDISEAALDFSTVMVGADYQLTFDILNDEEIDLNVEITHFNDAFHITPSSMMLSSGTQQTCTVALIPQQNIELNDTFVIVSETSTSFLPVQAMAHLADSRYANTYNLWDESLKSALYNVINNHHSTDYDGARDQVFWYLHNFSNRVECVYTGQWYNVNVGTTPNWNDVNTEHTWPQSQGATGDAKSDLHHLFPTNASVNSRRGSHPFGIVSNSSWQSGGSRMGTNSSGTTVFEPRTSHRGDLARAMLYFSLRYNNPHNFLGQASQEATFRAWNVDDPVSEFEQTRNAEIAQVQYKPNPFIDCPSFIERLYRIGSSGNRPSAPALFVSNQEINWGEVPPGAWHARTFAIINTGTANLSINSVYANVPDWEVSQYENVLAPMQTDIITVNFYAQQVGYFSGEVNITTSAGNYTIDLVADARNVGADDDDVIPRAAQTLQVYPNPWNVQANTGDLTLRFDQAASGKASIEVYNIIGQKVTTIFNGTASRGVNEAHWDGHDSYGRPVASGLYLYRYSTPTGQSVAKTLIVK